jgi:hypothetical protein
MKQIAFVVAAALCAASFVSAATSADFGMKIMPAVNTLGGGGDTASGTVNLTVKLDTEIDGTQGWSFGVTTAPGAGTTMNFTAVAVAADTMAVKTGSAKPDFQDTAFFAAGDLANAAGKADQTTGIAAIGIPDCTAVTQGIVIDFMQGISLGKTTDFDLLTLTVAVTGPVPGTGSADVGQVLFTDAVGNPATPTVVVYGGASIAPAIQAAAVIKMEKLQCAAANDFSIWMTSGECATGATIESTVTLNFNGNGTNGAAAIQGWSYGVCSDSRLINLAATTTGTDVATIKNGTKADFDTITVYPDQGVTHGVVIDFMAAITLAATNDYSDLKITATANVDADNPVANIRACDSTLGAPPTPNVMVVGGASLPASAFQGVLADRDSATGCCEAALAGDGKACNKPAEFKFSPGAKFVPGGANGDGRLDIADGIYILNYIFHGGPALPCEKAGDANGDCALDAADAIYIIYYQFLDGPEPVNGVGCQLIGNDVCPALTCNVQDAKCS